MRWVPSILRITLASLIGAAGVVAYAQGRSRPERGPAVGAEAPDFALSRLVEGKDEAKPETVRLSSFRGQRPVVLIFGSYT